jgi:hypothetical protein
MSYLKNNNLFYYRHFLPSGRADLATFAALQSIRSEVHSFTLCALHLWQPRLVNNPGKLT